MQFGKRESSNFLLSCSKKKITWNACSVRTVANIFLCPLLCEDRSEQRATRLVSQFPLWAQSTTKDHIKDGGTRGWKRQKHKAITQRFPTSVIVKGENRPFWRRKCNIHNALITSLLCFFRRPAFFRDRWSRYCRRNATSVSQIMWLALFSAPSERKKK